MSYDISCEALTDKERESGCGSHLWEYNYDNEVDKLEEEFWQDNEEVDKLEEEFWQDNEEVDKLEEIAWAANFLKTKSEHKVSQKKTEIINLIAGLNNNMQIKNTTFKKLYSDNLEYMIYTYSKIESLPYHYVYVSKQDNAIAILIKGFLKNNAKIVLATDLVKKIYKISYEIYENKNLDIVYDRVYKIQKFLHETVNTHKGEGAHLRLCATTMRHILSASRLHLNLQDINSLNTNSLFYLVGQSEMASKFEAKHPVTSLSSSGELYINYKRSRDMKSLFNFSYFNIESKILDVIDLDCKLPTEEFKKRIIDIYSDKRFCKI